VTKRADNTSKSRTSRASKPEGISSLRLILGSLGVGHMDLSKLSRVKHKYLHREVVKDLGMISRLHIKESEEDILFRQTGPY
jgi:hypothetical protein